jgi:HK97 family phage major capsid protein
MIGKLSGLKKAGARFWMHGEVLHHCRSLVDTTNRPIFFDTYGSPMPPTILGYPFTEVITMPSSTGANTAFAAFGNLRYLAVGNRLDSASLQVDPYGLWTTNRTRFKIYQRWGMKMGLPTGFVRLLTAS